MSVTTDTAYKFEMSDTDHTLFGALLNANKKFNNKRTILQDADDQELTYDRMILACLILGAKLESLLSHQSQDKPSTIATTAVLLPNVVGLPVTLFALNAFARTVVILNFTAGPKNIASAVQTSTAQTVITSRRFIAKAKLQDIIEKLEKTNSASGKPVQILYLEDVRSKISLTDKLLGFARTLNPLARQNNAAITPDSPAIILFTSGTEGDPKGVVLSNRNLLSNAFQIFAHAEGHLSPSDKVFNPLPMFHSFGLTAATLMPLFNGLQISLYPSPLQYRQIAKRIRETEATVVMATDTFLQGFARAADEGDLASVRLVVAGAESVKEKTRNMWAKTDTILLEGYGATECAPVIAFNIPSTNTPGSVGRSLPAIRTRLEPVPGINKGGRLHIKGPNVMMGYMLHNDPGKVVPLAGGWHDTGDIVTIDDGFVRITGRAKRFAKIGGEMVSLAAVETVAAHIWPEAQHVVVALPDQRKGEQLVLLTTQPDADKENLQKGAREAGFPELWVPKALLVVDSIPILGSGKVDLAGARDLAIKSLPLL